MTPVSELLNTFNLNGIKDMRLLVADDDATQAALLHATLTRAGFENITCLHQPQQVLETVEKLEPDLLLLNLTKPPLDSFTVMAELQVFIPEMSYLPVLVFINDDHESTRQRALASGVHDFLKKPFDSSEVVLRVRNLLRSQLFYKQLQAANAQLEQMVGKRTKQLEQAHLEMLTRLARVAEYRDDKSGEHSWRVAHLSAQLAQELDQEENYIKLLLRAARLHDVGKVAIPDKILMKPDKLTEQEFEIIKQHTTLGAQFLSGGRSTLIQMAETIALTHHERWDGTGYPNGLKGVAIPLEGRIVGLTDMFDSLTRDRYHRRALSPHQAVREIQAQSGKQFDPYIVGAFLRLHERGELIGMETIDPALTQW